MRRAAGGPPRGPGPHLGSAAAAAARAAHVLGCRVSWRSISQAAEPLQGRPSSQYTSLCSSSCSPRVFEKATCCWCCSSLSVTTCPWAQPGSAPGASSLHLRTVHRAAGMWPAPLARGPSTSPHPGGGWRDCKLRDSPCRAFAEQGRRQRTQRLSLAMRFISHWRQQGGRGPQHPLAARDGLCSCGLDGGVQGLTASSSWNSPLLLQGHGTGGGGHLPPEHRSWAEP